MRGKQSVNKRSVENHPEYGDEYQHLQETYSAIQAKIKTLIPPVMAADQRAAIAALKGSETYRNELKQALREPYFARVDWRSNGKPPEIFYFGKHEFSEKSVFSWKAPVSQIYYLGEWDTEPGERLLKRTFSISHNQLHEIRDEIVSPKRQELLKLKRATSAEYAMFGDELLATMLAEARPGRLHEIIASIQAEQYKIISSPLEQFLVIQGVAGSGKTAIALHRLAYLLYNKRGAGGITRKDVLLLAPSHLFLHYIERVLPELGERGIAQMTFEQWMFEKLEIEVDYVPEEDAIETLLNKDISEPVRIMHYRNARHLGSLEMKRLLDLYIERLFAQIIADLGIFSFSFVLDPQLSRDLSDPEDTEFTHTLAPGEIYKIFRKECITNNSNQALNTCQITLKKTLYQLFINLINDWLKNVQRAHIRENIQREMGAALDHRLTEYFKAWRKVNVPLAYRRLFRDSALLQEVGKGIFNRWDLELIHIDAPKHGTPFRFSDLGGLLYLHILLNGIDPKEKLGHIVIDEAQDISQLQFYVISQYSRNQSMTIMGDLGQCIYVDLGLRDWDDLKKAAVDATWENYYLQKSYRSTAQIIRYAAGLQQRIGEQSNVQPVPIAREGEPVEEVRFANEEERGRYIQKMLLQEQARGYKSIAVVTKTAAGARNLGKQLKQMGAGDVMLIADHNQTYGGGSVIIPSYLTKGLEFDVVFIADADANTYHAEHLDARLLYVSLTRASHKLYVGWIGQLTPLLDSAVTHLQLTNQYEANLEPELVTIEEYAQQAADRLSPDYYVERLVAGGNLSLLDEGRIDATTLSVLSSRWHKKSGDEKTAVELSPEVKADIRDQIETWRAQNKFEIEEALAFMQLSYGLLRNVIRTTGIELPPGNETNCIPQALVLARFLYAIRSQNIDYSVGAATTEKQVLSVIARHRRSAAQAQLQILIDHGLVSFRKYRRGDRISVGDEWVEGLLAAALGADPEQWEPELRQYLPRLPEPILSTLPNNHE